MPIIYDGSIARIEGSSPAEDADGLLEWLRRTPSPQVDLRAARDLHSAVIQVLFAAAARVSAMTGDRVLDHFLALGGIVPGTANLPTESDMSPAESSAVPGSTRRAEEVAGAMHRPVPERPVRGRTGTSKRAVKPSRRNGSKAASTLIREATP